MNIPVSKPYLPKASKKYLDETFNTGWVSSAGEMVERFEQRWAEMNGYKYGVSCSSGTTALVLACRALGLGARAIDNHPHAPIQRDEVIVPMFTMVASAWAVTMAGAKPVFVDVSSEDYNIDVEKIEAAINPNTKAIMPVHIYGRQCNMDAITKLAQEHNLKIIEDSAESHGVKPVGDIACFSLYGNKIITAGEGGICLTNDENLAWQMKHLRGMAFDPDHTFLHKKYAYNFRMTAMQAAIALGQLDEFDSILEKRRKIEAWYDAELKPLFETRQLYGSEDRDVVWFYDIRLNTLQRDDLRTFLAERGVETRVFFKSMWQQPMYFSPHYETTIAHRLSQEGLYLPTYTGMPKSEVTHVCDLIKEFFTKTNVKYV